MKSTSISGRIIIKSLMIFLATTFVLSNSLYPANTGWPKQIKTQNGKILIYQLQPESFAGDKLTARAAVSYTKDGATQSTFGAIWTKSKVNTDRENRTVTLLDMKITNVKFPAEVASDKIEAFKKAVEDETPKWELQFSLDDLLTSLQMNESGIKASKNLNNNPPEIIYVKQPSFLLSFDGEPEFSAIAQSDVKQAMNTPFFVVQDGNNHYYLYGGDFWYTTDDVLHGHWTNISELPGEVKKLQDQYNYETLKKKQQNQTTSNSTDTIEGPVVPTENYTSIVSQIIVRTTPAELIQSDGEPNFAPVPKTQLLYMTNTDNDVFMTIKKQQYFVLLSGRWYNASGLNGPWTYMASDKLPSDFSNIPEGFEKDIVLASIAGTDQANDAVLDAAIPQTVAVDRKEATCSVEYDGEPDFVQIEGTSIYRADNTNSSVLLFNNIYYVCDNAVWFTSSLPTGPWEVATSIPDEFQQIPADDPDYNVKYVYIYDVQPDEVFMGYTPGYTGCYVYGQTVVYGTGWFYHGRHGSHYYPRPLTWGFNIHYSPWTGWSLGYGRSERFFKFGYNNPRWHGGWWGPQKFHPPYFVACNHYYGPKPVVIKNPRQIHNVSNSNVFKQANVYKSTKGVSINSQHTGPKPVLNAQQTAGQSGAKINPSGNNKQTQGNTNVKLVAGGKANEASSSKKVETVKTPNNVVTSKDGDVYRKKGNKYQTYDGKEWKTVETNNKDTKPVVQTENANPKQQNTSGSKPQPQVQQPPKTSTPPQTVIHQQPKPTIQPDQQNFNRQEIDKQINNRDRGAIRQENQNSYQQRTNTAVQRQPSSQPAPAPAPSPSPVKRR